MSHPEYISSTAVGPLSNPNPPKYDGRKGDEARPRARNRARYCRPRAGRVWHVDQALLGRTSVLIHSPLPSMSCQWFTAITRRIRRHPRMATFECARTQVVLKLSTPFLPSDIAIRSHCRRLACGEGMLTLLAREWRSGRRGGTGPTKTATGPNASRCNRRASAPVDASRVHRNANIPLPHPLMLTVSKPPARQACIALTLVNLQVKCLEGYGAHRARTMLDFRSARKVGACLSSPSSFETGS